MKARAERMIEAAVKTSLDTIANLQNNLEEVMKAAEEVYTIEELAESRNYCALVSTHNDIIQTTADIMRWICEPKATTNNQTK